MAIVPDTGPDPIAEATLVASVQELVSRDARIFVLLIFNVRQATAVLYVASKYQLFSKDSIIFGNSVVSTNLLWQGITDVGDDNHRTVADILGGCIGEKNSQSNLGLNALNFYEFSSNIANITYDIFLQVL
jgi:hypothetical protein